MKIEIDIEQLNKILANLGFDLEKWILDRSDITDEGHGYSILDTEYIELSDICLKKKECDSDIFDLWVDYAHVDGLDTPLLYIKDIWCNQKEDQFSKYKISYIENPDVFIRNNISEEQYKELLKENYFKVGKHLTLWDEEKYKKYNSK